MNQDSQRKKLKTLVNAIRKYGDRLLENLSNEEFLWVPEGTRGRSIHSYLRHIINAEIFWLKQIGYQDIPDFLSKETSFSDLKKSYLELEVLLTHYLETATNEALIPNPPSKGPTLSWMIWRTSLHAIHHFAQISYIRYAIENPPKSIGGSWEETIDLIFSLNNPNII